MMQTCCQRVRLRNLLFHRKPFPEPRCAAAWVCSVIMIVAVVQLEEGFPVRVVGWVDHMGWRYQWWWQELGWRTQSYIGIRVERWGGCGWWSGEMCWIKKLWNSSWQGKSFSENGFCGNTQMGLICQPLSFLNDSCTGYKQCTRMHKE